MPGYAFKGVYQELQKRMGSSSQNYIIAARVTQGHEEWQNATIEEKQEIIRKWSALKVDLKKKKHPGQEQLEQMHSFVNEHKERKRTWKERRTAKKAGSVPQLASPNEPQESVAASELPGVSSIPPPYASKSPTAELSPSQDDDDEEAERAELEAAIHKSVADTSRGDPEQDEMIERAIRASVAELDRARTSETESDEDAMNRAMQASLDESQHFAAFQQGSDHPEAAEQALREAMRRSTLDRGKAHSLHSSAPPPAYDEAVTYPVVDAKRTPAVSREYDEAEEDELQKAMDASKISHSEYESRDPATGREHGKSEEEEIQRAIDASKASHEEYHNEMTRHKTEEDIVMEYIKKQSIAEEEHRQFMLAKGKGRMKDDGNVEHDEDLKKAIAMSMHREGEEGEGSGTQASDQ